MAGIEVPFNPQSSLTAQILQAITLANEEHSKRIQEAQGQQQLGQGQQRIDLEKQSQATDLPFKQAQTAAVTQQTAQKAESFPVEFEIQKMNRDILKGQLAYFSDSGNLDKSIAASTSSLGKLEPHEQAIMDAASQEAKIDRKFDPIAAAVKTIAQERATSLRTDENTPFKSWKSQFVSEKGREPDAKEIQDFQTAGARIRLEGLGDLRQDNYVDTSVKGGQLTAMTSNEFAAANKEEPGKFVKASPVVLTAMKGRGFINDIRDGMKQMSSAIDDPGFKLTSGGRALMSLATRDPEHASTAVVSGLAAEKLSEPEQNYLIAYASLVERAYSLRSLQSQGAGSDSQRAAIANLVPGLVVADKNMAHKLLKTLSNNVDNLDLTIPKVGKMNQSSAGGSGGSEVGPTRPKGVPENAVWDAATRTWSIK